MANELSEKLDRLEGRKAVACNEKCKYWAFPHRDIACVLSDVYSTQKGSLCFIFEERQALTMVST